MTTLSLLADGQQRHGLAMQAALVIGLTIQQVSQFRHMMSELEADMVQVCFEKTCWTAYAAASALVADILRAHCGHPAEG